VITVVAFELCVCPARRQSQDLDAAALLFSFSLDFVLFLLPNRVINDAKKSDYFVAKRGISWKKETTNQISEPEEQPYNRKSVIGQHWS